MGLDTGATMGEVIVAETYDASSVSVLPTAVEPTQHTAAIVTGFSGAPEVSKTCHAKACLDERRSLAVLFFCWERVSVCAPTVILSPSLTRSAGIVPP